MGKGNRMGKRKPKAPWWNRWWEAAFPPGTWSSRRQFLMQSGSRVIVLLLGGIAYCNHIPQSERIAEPQREILLRGRASVEMHAAPGSLHIGVYDTVPASDGVLIATAATTNSTSSNVICNNYTCESVYRVPGL